MSLAHDSGRLRLVAMLSATAALLLASGPVCAQDKDKEDMDVESLQVKVLLGQVQHQMGPCQAQLGGQASLNVPAGFAFIDEAHMVDLDRATRNTHSPTEKGALIELKKGWQVIFSFEAIGYVKDDEKGKLKADELLDQLRKNQEEGNKQRLQLGYDPLTINGWAKPPFFDEDTKNLTWGLRLTSARGGESVNYDSRILGRKGVMTATLVLSPDQLATAIPRFNGIVKNNYKWSSGESYAEWREGDKVAEYGLAGLIAGGTVAVLAKSGILGKFLKPIIVGVVALFGAIGSFFKKLFGRRETA